MTRKLSRRSLLKGVLAGGAIATVGLPALELFLNTNGDAYADGGGFPPRFGVYFWGNGVLPERFIPTGEGADWQLSEQLQPLASVKDDITVVSGLEIKTGNVIPHGSGAAGILSGAPLIVKTNDDNSFSSPTVDVLMAREIGGDTRFQALHFGAEPGSGLSYNAPYNQNPFEKSPYALFERVFGEGFRAPGETTEVDPSIALRRSVLDVVSEDIKDLKRRVGVVDQQRLEQHFTSVRELELRLARLEEDPPQRAACSRPEEAPQEEYPFIDGRPQLSAKNRAMSDILAMALACDQTRVFHHILTRPVNNLLLAQATEGHHQLTHNEPGDQPQVHQIVLALMEEYAYFLNALKAIPEGDSTLLDNCIVLGTTDVCFGRTHTIDDFPIILAGSAGGRLVKGVHYRSKTKENTSSLVYTLMRAAGSRATSFGLGPGRVTDTIGGLEA